MGKTEHEFTADDGVKIVYYKHAAEDAKASVIIVHGMAEHAQRYDEFADFLSKNGFNVYAYDQRGHGKTAGSIEKLGFFAEKEGWNKVTADLKKMIERVKSDSPGLPVFLLGHSMGTFVVRTYIADYNDEVNGVLLSGTAGSAGLLGKAGILLTELIMLFKKKDSPSPLMNAMSFGDFNKAFKPNRTDFDWLCRDDKKVDEYVNDPFCGAVFSAGFYNDMLKGLEYVNKKDTASKVRKDLPMYLFAGDKDPVSKNAKGVKEVYDMYKDAGISDITVKLYPDARHECLNEINRDEVYEDVLKWINSKL
ncbi:MAG: alpha/beta hydrolase [Chlorobi bacterium]|nr:alpha/beta hydrolase [Chlorobiota bacterium]